ncbi:cholinephosphotransferase 1-like [Genypterus blacodes]|uniref:cholinephosphotransferase 1-like n=1 Tax=Genypterus blacodes TaxID=154954 RepID=UPI003F761C8F
MSRYLWPEPLTAAQLKPLADYEYSVCGETLLDTPCQIYWRWLVQKIPIWVSPNTLTVAGLLVYVLCTLVLVYHCPTATEEAPSWAFIMSALGLFIYQSLDNIDGKQALRTDHSAPLAELFDHCCDSISAVLITVGACIAGGIGRYTDWTFFCGFIGLFLFFCSHWETYVSGTVHFNLFDVTEVQFAVMIMYLMSAFGGVSLWQTLLPIIGLKLYTLPLMGIILGAVYSCLYRFHGILKGGLGKKGSTMADTSVLRPGLDISLILTLAFIIFKKSPSQLFEHHPCLYLLAFGMIISKLINKLVVAHIGKCELYLPDTAFIGPGLLLLNQYFNSFIDEYIVLWIVMVLSVLDVARYFTGACLQMTSHLGIQAFSNKALHD